jgi:hypothetical protein
MDQEIREMLTENKKVDRTKMAKDMEAIITVAGATFEREDGNSIEPQCIRLNVRAAHGLRVSVEFDGQSCQPNVYVLSWNISHTDARLSHAFPNVNPVHYQKSTDVCYGFEHLCFVMKRRLEVAANGTAFSAERQAEYQRKTDAGEHVWQRIAVHQAANPTHGILGTR